MGACTRLDRTTTVSVQDPSPPSSKFDVVPLLAAFFLFFGGFLGCFSSRAVLPRVTCLPLCRSFRAAVPPHTGRLEPPYPR